ncbi:MAG: hypothetical protein M1281_01590 [Chloroflexi bacterium]|nr:hypothetical protein [Chloroflexota bacterium]
MSGCKSPIAARASCSSCWCGLDGIAPNVSMTDCSASLLATVKASADGTAISGATPLPSQSVPVTGSIVYPSGMKISKCGCSRYGDPRVRPAAGSLSD